MTARERTPRATGSGAAEPAPIPDRMRALVLSGTGFQHLAVQTVPTPRPGPRQLLARVDAAGICTSLVKLIHQGPSHALMHGWDPERHPIVLGDEGSITLVHVGQALRDRYREGERYVVQPAVDHEPMQHRDRFRDAGAVHKLGVGYTLPGHLAEYVLIGEEVLEAGCLVAVPDSRVPFAHAAMAEPISCVVSAHAHHVRVVQDDPRRERRAVAGLREGGTTVVVGAGAMGRMHVDVALQRRPRRIVVVDVLPSRIERTLALFAARAADRGVELETAASIEEAKALVDERTGHRGADDVIVAAGSAPAAEDAHRLCGRGGVLHLFGGFAHDARMLGLDGNRIHYGETVVTGSSGGSPWDVARTLELLASGDIDASAHVTRVGDLAHAPELIASVERRELDGKAVLYPHRRIDRILAVDRWTADDEARHLEPS